MSQEQEVKLSIVVPCYNVERYLAACLDSLLAQDMDQIEIICVNDGSPDGSRDIMRSYERAHPNLIRCVDRENGGLWNARWSGIDVARGEYTAFVDSDDTVTPDFARSLYMGARSANADIAVCGFSRIDLETGKVLSRELCEIRKPFFVREEPGRMIEVNPAAWNKAYRTSVLRRMQRLSETPPILEDLALVLLAYPELQGCVTFVPKSLINYMVHADSMVNTITVAQVDAVKRMLLEVRTRYQQDDVTEEMRRALDAVAFLHLGVSMSFRLSCSKDVNLREQLARTTAYLDENFPSWRRSEYTRLSYASGKVAAYKKLFIAKVFYTAGLMKPFLSAYRFAINKLGIDIKW